MSRPPADDDVVVGPPLGFDFNRIARAEEAANASFDAALSAVADGRYAQAVVHLERCLDVDPDDAIALFHLASVERDLGRPHTARASVERLYEAASDEPGLLHLITELRWATGDIEGTVQAADRVIALEPLPSAYGLRGLALERLAGREADAAEAMHAAFMEDPAAWPLPLAVEDADWAPLLAAAMARLDPELRSWWGRLPIRWEDWPAPQDIAPRGGVGPEARVIGAEPGDHGTEPSVLRLFRRNLARACHRDALVCELAAALEGEAEAWTTAAP